MSTSSAQIEPNAGEILNDKMQNASIPNAVIQTPSAEEHEGLAMVNPADGGILQGRQAAFRDLFALWKITLPEDVDACTFASTQGLACLQQVGDMGRLRLLNRPAVLPWQSDDGDIVFITIISLSGSTARAIAGDVQIELPLEQLSQHWMSKFTLLWRTPPAYQNDILPGTAGPSAKWLNERLSILDPVSAAESKSTRISGIYQGAWVRKLRQFQSDAGLFPDGVAGPQTLIQLNTQLHEPGPRLMMASEESQTATPQQAVNH